MLSVGEEARTGKSKVDMRSEFGRLVSLGENAAERFV
jgi:hypothetical protein